MDEKSLIEIVLNGETERVEFKKSTAQLDKSLKTICGFLNNKDGTVYFES
ncbi:MAG: ATP-binding protein [DPANN group archaeon]|nr:ATP-binding protein [DPANN group archaeon]